MLNFVQYTFGEGGFRHGGQEVWDPKKGRASALEHPQHRVEIFTQRKIEPSVQEFLSMLVSCKKSDGIRLIQGTIFISVLVPLTQRESS